MIKHYCESLIDNYDLAPSSWMDDDLRCQEPAVGKLHGRWLCEHHLELEMRLAEPVEYAPPPHSMDDL